MFIGPPWHISKTTFSFLLYSLRRSSSAKLNRSYLILLALVYIARHLTIRQTLSVSSNKHQAMFLSTMNACSHAQRRGCCDKSIQSWSELKIFVILLYCNVWHFWTRYLRYIPGGQDVDSVLYIAFMCTFQGQSYVAVFTSKNVLDGRV